MSTPSQIIPVLEGMVGFQIGSADGGSIQGSQTVATWVNLVKWLLYQPAYRYLDDLNFVLSPDVDDTGAVIDTSATHLIAGLIEMVSTIATDTAGWVGYTDGDSDTIEIGAAALPDDIAMLIHVRDVLTTGVSEFYPFVVLAGAAGTAGAAAYGQTGITLDTGLTVWCDGDGGNDVATDGCRVWTLYRD